MSAPAPSPPNGFVNEVRLNLRQWLLTAAVVLVVALATPVAWKRWERFDLDPDYRIPYALSRDYWLYQWRAERITAAPQVPVLGDSVVWGEYVRPDGTLTHFLNQRAGAPERFVNAGVNGMFPLALEGLVRHYGGAWRGRRILLHCNVLWMSSPVADLSSAKEEKFNHARLVPQFSPRIPCYRADAQERLTAVIERNVPFFQWAAHLQNTSFDQKSVLQWTLASDNSDPPRYPNSYRSPLAQITFSVPGAPEADPLRGPESPRHKSWTASGGGTTSMEWVDPDRSLQWASFQRLVRLLRQRGNEVFVLVGPFNEHFLQESNRVPYRHWIETIHTWLDGNGIPCAAPTALPSALYADASHPLTAGYEMLAGQLWENESLQKFLQKP